MTPMSIIQKNTGFFCATAEIDWI